MEPAEHPSADQDALPTPLPPRLPDTIPAADAAPVPAPSATGTSAAAHLPSDAALLELISASNAYLAARTGLAAALARGSLHLSFFKLTSRGLLPAPPRAALFPAEVTVGGGGRPHIPVWASLPHDTHAGEAAAAYWDAVRSSVDAARAQQRLVIALRPGGG